MLHRAILGSFERFIGILLENTTGRLPLWLAPTQIVIASITTNVAEYTSEVARSFKNVGLRCKVDDNRNEKINYKVREHSLSKIPLIAVVGEKEIETRSINLRRLGRKESQTISLDAAIKALSMEATPPDIKRKKIGKSYSNKLNPINFDKKELEIVRRNQEMTSGQKEVAARVNASIICKEVRLIDADGNMVGIVSPEKANIMASEVRPRSC